MRHPRYAAMSLGLLGYCLIASDLPTFLLLLGYLPAIYVVVRLEEHELRERFGQAYEDYARGVPRFAPRLGRG